MARMSIEQKLADKMHETMMRVDFDPDTLALYIHRCGWMFQQVVLEFIKRMIRHWAIDYDNQVTRNSDEYLEITIRARQLQDVVDKWK